MTSHKRLPGKWGSKGGICRGGDGRDLDLGQFELKAHLDEREM